MRRASPLLSPRALLALLPLLLSACGPSSRQLPSQSGAIAPRPEERQCLAGLGERHTGFTPLPDRYFAPGCAGINTVRLFSLSGDRAEIEVSNLPEVACPIATGFANWVRFGVDRAAREMLGSPVARVETMGAYSCRNIAGSDMRSAHATASAIDISGVTLADGRHITMLGNWYAGTRDERAFLRVIHQSACRRFGTVLGPDYNTAHRNHLHIEMSRSAFCR